MKRHLLSSLVLAALAVCSGPLRGEDQWDMGMRISGGTFSGAADAGLGRNYFMGLSGEGAYPFTPEHWLACDAGYRQIPRYESTPDKGKTVIRVKTEGFFAGAYYRFQFPRTWLQGWAEGFYVQGGLRLQSLKTEKEVATTTSKAKATGPRNNAIQPLVGAGFRVSEKISVNLNLVGMSGTNLTGKKKSGMALEAGLGIHF